MHLRIIPNNEVQSVAQDKKSEGTGLDFLAAYLRVVASLSWHSEAAYRDVLSHPYVGSRVPISVFSGPCTLENLDIRADLAPTMLLSLGLVVIVEIVCTTLAMNDADHNNAVARRTLSSEHHTPPSISIPPSPTPAPRLRFRNAALARRSANTCGFVSDPSNRQSFICLHGTHTST